MKKNYTSKKLTAYFVFLLFFISIHFTAKAGLYPFSAVFSGANEVPPNASTATGTIVGVYDDVTNRIFYTINFSGLSANTTAAHFHAPAAAGVNAGVTLAHAAFPAGVTSGTYSKIDVFTNAQEINLLAGLMYSNIHTTLLPGGEIRAQIILGPASPSIYTFSKAYSGTQEVPANGSPATGTIAGVYNEVTNTIFYNISFSGLTANTTAAHFHAPAAPGTNAGVTLAHAGFPAGVMTGTFTKSDVFTNAQETNLLAGLMYSNIHTTVLPGGEIRTQIFFDAPFVAPTITCPANITASNTTGLCSGLVAFAATVTGTPAPVVTYKIGATVITSPHTFPVGTTTVNASALNGGGYATCSFTVTVNDTEAPVINNLSASPNTLWPPNHKMKDVTVNYTSTDNCPGPISCQVSVTSDEPVNEVGDGNTGPDWIVTDNHHVKLRAERSGTGDGRVYTITVSCTDQVGNIGTATTTVTVPHDMSGSVSGNSIVMNEAGQPDILAVRALPNPSRNYFTLHIQSGNSTEYISVKLFDVTGRLVTSRNSISSTQTVRIGNNLKAGIYFVEVRQGAESRKINLVKIE